MSVKSSSSLFKNITDSLLEKSSVNPSADDIGFQTYYQEQIEKDHLQCCPENEVKYRTQWDSFRVSRKKSFIKSKCASSTERKRNHSQQSSSVNSTSTSTPVNGKKVKLETKDTCKEIMPTLNEETPSYIYEIQRLISSPAHYNFQPVCQVCEIFTDNLTVVRCTGVCLRYFHRDCLVYPSENPLPADTNFQCVECWANTYKCMICTNLDKITMLIHCEVSDCGRLYHKNCLSNSNFPYIDICDDSVKSCPAHHCFTCAREDRSTIDKPCNKLFQCIRCPMAFHDADLCTAAGSVELSLSNVVCPVHFENNIIKINTLKPSYPDVCFKCFKTGPKLRCRYCPSSFHFRCTTKLKHQIDKDHPFICHDCRIRRQPRYGEIVFVKVSMFRWWPCEIIHPRNAPMNLLKMKRPDGTFPILFLGSQEYQWATRSRTIYYNTAIKSSIVHDSRGSSKTGKDFTNGLERAAIMHKLFVNILLKHVPLKSITAETMSKHELLPYIKFKDIESKTTKYRLIKENIVVTPTQLPPILAVTICDCIDSCEKQKCKNYLNKIACNKDLCPMENNCYNQIFDNHSNKHLGVTKTNSCGFGLRTTKDLTQNEFIIEYLGEIITKTMGSDRMNVTMKNYIKDSYMLHLNEDLVIDAGPKGNLSRFINHSCNPNCRVEKWIVNGYPRLGIFADRNIEPGEELTFDYRHSGFIMTEDMFCLCNGKDCSGFLGPEKTKTISPMKTMIKSPIPDTFVTVNKKNLNPLKVENSVSIFNGFNSIKQIVNSINDSTIVVDSQNNIESNKNSHIIEHINDTKLQEIFKQMNQINEPGILRNFDDISMIKPNVDDELPKINTLKTTVLTPPKVDHIQEAIESILSSINSFEKKPDFLKETQNVFLMDDSLNAISSNVESLKKKIAKASNKKLKLMKKLTNKKEHVKINPLNSFNKNNEKVNQIGTLTDSVKETSRTSDAFEDYLKSIGQLKKSQKKTNSVQESHRKFETRRESVSKPVPFEEYVKKIEYLKEVEKKNEAILKSKRKSIDSRKLIEKCMFSKEGKKEIDQDINSVVTLSPSKDVTEKIEITKIFSNKESLSDDISKKESNTKDLLKCKSLVREDPKENLMPKEESPIKFTALNRMNIETLSSEESTTEALSNEERIVTEEFVTESEKSALKSISNDESFAYANLRGSSLTDSTVQSDEFMSDKNTNRESLDSLFKEFVDIRPKKDVIYESFCFRCFDGGELVLCDKPGCTKTYHLSCIGLKKAPFGTWYCPWHFCDTCGQPSALFCAQCPASYCHGHCEESKIRLSLSGSQLSLCDYHSQWQDRVATVK